MSNRTGIVYFSKDGSTKILANILAKKYDAKVIELIEMEKKAGIIVNSIRATKKKSVTLVGDPSQDINDLTKLFLCTPIWASNGTPAMNSFIENTDFDSKEVVIITVKAFTPSNKLKKVYKYLSDLVVSKSGNVVECFDIHGAGVGKTANSSHILEQIDNLNI